MKKILVTGGNGYIAKCIATSLTNLSVKLLTRQECDLLQPKQVANFFTSNNYDTIIHTAAVGGSRLQNDDKSVCYDNIAMWFNILPYINSFSQVIMLGSGAESSRQFDVDTSKPPTRFLPIDPYGMSKLIINKFTPAHAVIFKIFNMFDNTEKNTRFIKNNMMAYIKHLPMSITKDRFMSFFSIIDFIKILQFIIDNNHTNLKVDCTYDEPHLKLSDIANIINELDKHKVNIQTLQSGDDFKYIGDPNPITEFCSQNSIKLTGLKGSLQDMHKKLTETIEN